MSVGDIELGDAAQLRKAGTGATEVAGETETAGKHPVDETRGASQSFRGGMWDGKLGTALDNLVEVWSSQTSALAGKCHSLGTRCMETAENYSSVETQNASAFSDVAKGTHSPSPFG
ncbi:putative glycosyl hydrolase [Streptomyces sp. NBRC 110611]|uniref:type VII secretion target n=1 Tax=Streptomyces sp. NBRC 110611 TaxID=1621259 RepID=UPI0008354569|nr:type VII secretion target [Streptomyces sp. NBRC 110611]GAU67492.1 putative glycosyl hydrolase [Streptomyces sp. NBRC 110611]